MSRGRKARLTEEKYLKAVKRTKSTKDSIIGKLLGMDRTTVYYFRKNNPISFEKAQNIIAEMESMRFDSKYISFEVFKQLPTIIGWDEKQIGRVKPDTRQKRMIFVYNVCRHLKVHPDNLSLENASTFVKKMRDMPKAVKEARDEKGKLLHPEYHGLAYYSIRKPLRSFFQLVRGISGELLTAEGIDAGRSEGTGKSARERVTKEQRKIFEDELRRVIKNNVDTICRRNIDDEIMFREILGATHFMYYTATRIGSTNPTEAGTISIIANNPKHFYTPNLFSINLWDKGKRNKYIEWDKMLMDDGITKFTDYVTNRFDIQKRNLNNEMPNLNTPLFPVIQKHHSLETKLMKETLRRCGNMTTQPNHVWRHTFAQDCLHATDWNYELVASLGGWKDTNTLKLSYGEMSDDARKRGLRTAMKLPVEDVTYKLMW